jgi:hypothetical protein
MTRLFLIFFALISLSGCAAVGKYWPRDHDPVLVDRWVTVDILVENVNCAVPEGAWAAVVPASQHLWRLAEFRSDPQTDNLKGLYDHAVKTNQSKNKTFCELGKKTAQARLAAARTAWEGR